MSIVLSFKFIIMKTQPHMLSKSHSFENEYITIEFKTEFYCKSFF